MSDNSLIKNIRKVFRPIKQIRRQKQEKNFFKGNLRSSDIFLVGHPKSGNTWIAFMLGIVIEKNFNKSINLGNVQEFVPAVHSWDRNINLYAHLPVPRIFRNHGPLYPDLYPKTIYIVRDPRSVYISFYHHCMHDMHIRKKENFPRAIESFVDEMLTYGCIRNSGVDLVRWDKQVLEWLKRSKNQMVKIVKYEDMKMDRRKVLEDLIEFVGIPCSEEDINTIVERSSFDSMRKEEKIFGATPYSGTKGEGGFYVRKGKANGWKEELPQSVIKKIENKFAPVMKKFGYLP